MSRVAEPKTPARITTDPRISRRRKAVARARRRRALVTAAALAIVVALAWLAFMSPLLAVERVVVVGGRHVSAQEVAAAAGLGSGDNLLLLSTERVAERVARLPWVRRARVTRRLPDTVRVRVTERRPAMVLSTAGEKWTLDRAGRVLGKGAAGRALPVLGGVRTGDVGPGEVLAGGEVGAALEVWRSLPRALRKRVAGIFAPSPERITLALDDDTVVRYGAAESKAAKSSVLRALLARVRAEGASVAYVDVRVPASPAISTMGAQPPPAALIP